MSDAEKYIKADLTTMKGCSFPKSSPRHARRLQRYSPVSSVLLSLCLLAPPRVAVAFLNALPSSPVQAITNAALPLQGAGSVLVMRSSAALPSSSENDREGHRNTRKEASTVPREPAGVECLFFPSLGGGGGRLRRHWQRRRGEALMPSLQASEKKQRGGESVAPRIFGASFSRTDTVISKRSNFANGSVGTRTRKKRGIRRMLDIEPWWSTALVESTTTTDTDAKSSSTPMPIAVDVWRLEQTKRSLSSLSLAACVDENERNRLAALKLLSEDALSSVKTLSVPSTADGLTGVVIDPVEDFPDAYGDLRLLRFLRKDKRQDPTSAAMRFMKYVTWRKDKKVDLIRFEVGQNPFRPPGNSAAALAELVPCNFDLSLESRRNHNNYQDVSNAIPALLEAGNWDTPCITHAIRNGSLTLDEFLEYWIYLYESVHFKLYDESKSCSEMVYVDEICDLTNMSLSQFGPGFVSRVLRPWLQMTQSYYPETTRKIIFFNPPKIMNIIWNIVTPMASEGTVKKIQFAKGYGISVESMKKGKPEGEDGKESLRKGSINE